MTTIQCKLVRDGGTRVELDGIEYHFTVQADGAHVASVASEAHQDRLLAIPEAYCLYRGKSVAPVEPEGDDADERAELAAEYEAKLGKKPHYNMGLDKMRAALADA